MDNGIFRAVEDAVDALARLDQSATTAPASTPTLLLLRSSQTIVAANDRPPEADRSESEAFAALLGWWYAPEAREFIADDPHLRAVATALHAAADMVRAGRALTLGLLEEAMAAGALSAADVPYAFEWMLRRAELEEWSALRVAAEVSSGACGAVRGIAASVARAVAPLAGGVVTDVFVLPPTTEDVPSALHALGGSARAARRTVARYVDECSRAVAACDGFGRGRESAQALVHQLGATPAMTIARAASALRLSIPTAGAAVERLEAAGVVREITGRGRDRVYVYTPALTLVG